MAFAVVRQRHLWLFYTASGPCWAVKTREALSVAAVLGLSAAALFYWASLRVTDVDDVFEIGFDPAAFCVLIFIGHPLARL